MRWFKLFTTGLVLVIIYLFFDQNAGTFNTTLPFKLDLYIHEQVSWSHSLYALLITAFLLGLIVGVSIMLKPYLHLRRLLARERQEKQEIAEQVVAPIPSSSPTEELSDQL